MKSLLLNIPDTIDLNEKEALMVLAVSLYQKGKLTMGQAAEVVGLSKRTMMELLIDYNIPIINHESQDLESDLENAKNHSS